MTFKVASIGEFARWTKLVVADPEAGQGVPRTWFETEETAVTSRTRGPTPEGLLRLLSGQNLALLQIIGREKPTSMRALADLAGRKQPNLSRALKRLAEAGLVRLDPGPKHTVAPRLLAHRVTLDLDLMAMTGSVSIGASRGR